MINFAMLYLVPCLKELPYILQSFHHPFNPRPFVSYFCNHGITSRDKLRRLIILSKVFVGHCTVFPSVGNNSFLLLGESQYVIVEFTLSEYAFTEIFIYKSSQTRSHTEFIVQCL